MMKQRLCLYVQKSLPDRLICALHNSMKNTIVMGLNSPPKQQEISERILNRDVVIVGSQFSHLFDYISDMADNVTFILRPEDDQPDRDRTGAFIENWYQYWNDVKTYVNGITNSSICDIINSYMYEFPSIHVRRIYHGLKAYGIENMDIPNLVRFLSEKPFTLASLENCGKQYLQQIEPIIHTRMFRSKRVQIEHEGIDYTVEILFGDVFVRDTALAIADINRTIGTIVFYADLANSPSACGEIVTRAEVITALDIGRSMFGSASGTNFVAEFNVPWEKMGEYISS
jgi:hypothetical protein